MFLGLPGASNTISNSSSMRGWLESTGLDDIVFGSCSCLFGEQDTDTDPPPPCAGDKGRGRTTTQPGRNKRVIKAGTTVDGTPLLIQETSGGIFCLPHFFGGSNRYEE